jgi:hypothetical protein
LGLARCLDGLEPTRECKNREKIRVNLNKIGVKIRGNIPKNVNFSLKLEVWGTRLLTGIDIPVIPDMPIGFG